MLDNLHSRLAGVRSLSVKDQYHLSEEDFHGDRFSWRLEGLFMAKRATTVQYRYLKTENLGAGFELKAAVVDVLRRVPKDSAQPISRLARLRIKDLDQDGSFVLLNKLAAEEAWDGPAFYGQLLHVKNSREFPGLLGSLEDDTPEFELGRLTLEQQTQLVEGVLYFALVGNHVGVIEGQRTRGRTLERYLTRLMQDAGEFEPGEAVILNTKLQGEVSRVTEMDVSPARSYSPVAPDDPDGLRATEAGAGAGRGSTVMDVLRLLGWSDQDRERLEESIPVGGWLEGLFKVKLMERKGRKAALDRETLEEALRNLDPTSVGLLGSDGREKGGLIKLTDRVSVETQGDLLDPEDAMGAIVTSMRKWAAAGKIDCNFG